MNFNRHITPNLYASIVVLETLLQPCTKFYAVGGFVRDVLMGKTPKDIDLVVQSAATDEQLMAELSRVGRVTDSTGKNFGVFRVKIDGVEYEVARTRTERGGGASTATEVSTDGVTLSEDLHRRDLTINAGAYDITNRLLIDLLDCQGDIQRKRLKMCSDSFSESIERPLRLANAAAMFDECIVDLETFFVCKDMAKKVSWGTSHSDADRHGLSAIPRDQIWSQWSKAMKRDYPGNFLQMLAGMDWLRFMPELNNLIGCEQEPAWHPEGDAFKHTCLVMNEAAVIAKEAVLSEDATVVLVTAAACHDIGKPPTTAVRNGRITSYNHDTVGAEMSKVFLRNIGAPNRVVDRVAELVSLHMFHTGRKQQKHDDTARWLLSEMVYNHPEMLLYLIKSDIGGRPPLPKELPEKIAATFQAAQGMNYLFIPIVTGQFLIDEFGIKPSEKFGRIIHRAREAQIKGIIRNKNDAKNWIRRLNVLGRN